MEKTGLLYVVTEPGRPGAGSAAESHLLVGREALEGGADFLQFRNKDAEGGNVLEKEKALAVCFNLKKFCEARGSLFIVNDDLELAKESGADGVHLGQADLKENKVEEAKKVLGRNGLVGVSASTVEEALQAIVDKADYVGYGPIFKTGSKEDAATPVGLEGGEKLRKEFDRDKIRTPIIAIGGITEENAASVIGAGADGVAVISAVSRAEDMKKAAEKLKELISLI